MDQNIPTNPEEVTTPAMDSQEEIIVPILEVTEEAIDVPQPKVEELDDFFAMDEDEQAITGNQRDAFQPGCYIIKCVDFAINKEKVGKEHIILTFENVETGHKHNESFYANNKDSKKISIARFQDIAKFAGAKGEIDKLKAAKQFDNMLAIVKVFMNRPFKAIFVGKENVTNKGVKVLNVNLGKMTYENEPLEYNPELHYTKFVPSTQLGMLEELPMGGEEPMPGGTGLFSASNEAFPAETFGEDGKPLPF
jgi:hypothetical protein